MFRENLTGRPKLHRIENFPSARNGNVLFPVRKIRTEQGGPLLFSVRRGGTGNLGALPALVFVDGKSNGQEILPLPETSV